MAKASKVNERMAQAQRIAANPRGYKVCDGCDSIIGAAAVLCPSCHSFRFDATSERVVRQALILGRREQSSVTAEDLG
jgi:RNA polymerase subunit RPABC4/transcription elongation factor Spt4